MKVFAAVKIRILRFLVGLMRRVYEKPDGQQLLFHSVPYMEEIGAQVFSDVAKNYTNPYQLGVCASGREDIINNNNVVFITGRFRSGSTLLWNMLRDVPHTTSYYEPFNERQWFNKDKRGENIDKTHLGVEDYWREYDGLDTLGRFFKERWGENQFYMTASTWEPGMVRYIDELIRSGDKRVVLQFNRIDFRLSWIRQHYPKAKIIHIYRHPREQWLSLVKNAEECSPFDSFESLGDKDFFYLRRWARDLRHVFPFLDESQRDHLYEVFYLIWRLSYNHGLTYADYSLSMEDLSDKAEVTLSKLFALINIDQEYMAQALSKINNKQVKKSQNYADDSWFEKFEERSETILDEYYFCRNTQTN